MEDTAKFSKDRVLPSYIMQITKTVQNFNILLKFIGSLSTTYPIHIILDEYPINVINFKALINWAIFRYKMQGEKKLISL